MPYNTLLRHNGYVRLHDAVPGPQEYRDSLRCECADRVAADMRFLENGVAATLSIDLKNPLFNDLIHRGKNLLGYYFDFTDIRFISGALIPKFPNEPRRAWHVDWWAWDAPETQWSTPPQVGVIFYLDNATMFEGCFSCIPGSHRVQLPEYTEIWNTQADKRIDEEFVYVGAGDAIVFDARLMHAVTARSVPGTRIAVTMWYMIDWPNLSEGVRAMAVRSVTPDFKEYLGDLYPEYTDTAEPTPMNTYPKFPKPVLF